MRIAIFGRTQPEAEAFRTFCRQFGEWIAPTQHTVIVQSSRESTADWHVVQGILAKPAATVRIERFHRLSRHAAAPFADESSAHPNRFRPVVPVRETHVGVAHLMMLQDCDVAIVIGGKEHSYQAGLAAATMGVRLIPVAAFEGAGRELWQVLSHKEYLGPHTPKLPSDDVWDRLGGGWEVALNAVMEEIRSFPRIMLVHGHGDDWRHVASLAESYTRTPPSVLQQQGRTGLTITEKFEREARQADGAIALFTPDDLGAAKRNVSEGSNVYESLASRARQNVCLEYGWFWGMLGRGRVLLLLREILELPSDIGNIDYVPYSHPADPIVSVRVNEFIKGLRDR